MNEYEDFRFETRDGLKLYARDYARDRAGPAVICIPGLTRNSADFARLCLHLSDRFRVVAVDLRGRGKSGYDTNPENYHPGVYVQDVVELLDALDLEKVILVGSSLGGLISMILAATIPDRVAAVVLNDIGPEINPDGLVRIKSYVGNPARVENWQQAVAVTKSIHGSEFPDLDEESWETFTGNLYREDEDGRPVLAYDPSIAELMMQADDDQPSQDLWPVFETIPDMPFMLIRGALSDIITPAVVKKMQQVMPGIKVVEVENRGHAPLLTEPECLENIDAMLNKHFLPRV